MLQVYTSREGVIIECPLNGQFHNSRDLIITSQMAVSNNFIYTLVLRNTSDNPPPPSVTFRNTISPLPPPLSASRNL